MRASKLSSPHRRASSTMPVGSTRACWVLMCCPFLLAAQTQVPLNNATQKPDPSKPEPVKTSITVVEKISAETPANVTTLDSTALQQSPGTNLDDRLRDVPGFSLFRRSSSLAANPTTQGISLRGIGSSGASRTLVLWDGIPANDPFGGWVYWTQFVPAEIARAEISRGAATSIFGDRAMSGAIGIFSRQAEHLHVLGEYEFGNGTTTKSLTPVPVTGLSSGVVAVSAGSAFSCALTHGGTVMCWGVNTTGNLGNGTTTDSDVPVQVKDAAGTGTLGGVVAISAGQYHVCAVTNTGAVLCWGDNAFGELGPEPSGFRTGLPNQVTGIPADIVAISAGSYFTCALTSTAAAWCWGSSGDGALGAGPNLPNSNPVAVLDVAGTAPLSGVAQISAGFNDTCAIMNAGATLCWGANQSGGDGDGPD